MSRGCKCPECEDGRLYEGDDRKGLSFDGNAPVTLTRHRKKALRCNGCGREFMSRRSIVKWSSKAKSAIALDKVNGRPFHRLATLQSLYGIPISPNTLWQQVLALWKEAASHIFNALIDEAANCKEFYADDTRARILNIEKTENLVKQERSSFTTVIRSKTGSENDIILYLTRQRHCGENMDYLLEHRKDKSEPIKYMCDALSRNNPKKTITPIEKFTCLVHGRRKFYELRKFYPQECNYFLCEISAIYILYNKGFCEVGKEKASIHIDNIYKKINSLFSNNLVEPNSSLGKAMKYWIKNKSGLTRFLTSSISSLDNNSAERSLRSIILQRKNSYFFKSNSSANILSGISSIVETCKENGINAFDYLNWIQDNMDYVAKEPYNCLPWNYRHSEEDYTERIAA